MLITKSKKKHLSKFFQENCFNSKKAWSKINEILNRERNKMMMVL